MGGREGGRCYVGGGEGSDVGGGEGEGGVMWVEGREVRGVMREEGEK